MYQSENAIHWNTGKWPGSVSDQIFLNKNEQSGNRQNDNKASK
jgi:hypothetical protein